MSTDKMKHMLNAIAARRRGTQLPLAISTPSGLSDEILLKALEGKMVIESVLTLKNPFENIVNQLDEVDPEYINLVRDKKYRRRGGWVTKQKLVRVRYALWRKRQKMLRVPWQVTAADPEALKRNLGMNANFGPEEYYKKCVLGEWK